MSYVSCKCCLQAFARKQTLSQVLHALSNSSEKLIFPLRKIEGVRNCVSKYSVLNTKLRQEKGYIEGHGLQVLIVEDN